jgi:hypothetical protein
MQATLENTVVVLPVCTYLDTLDGSQRERDLFDTVRHIRKYLPSIRIYVIDNGSKPVPLEGENLEYIHQPELYRRRKLHGELQMLRFIANILPPDTIVLKMHGRCRIWNMGSLLRFLQTYPCFALVNRQVFSKARSGRKATPFAETRVFSLTASHLADLLYKVESVDETLGRVIFERGLYLSMLQERRFIRLLIYRGKFWPVFLGQAGHNRNYSEPKVFLLALIKSMFFRLGL